LKVEGRKTRNKFRKKDRSEREKGEVGRKENERRGRSLGRTMERKEDWERQRQRKLD
jgi:hypothetical protein